MVWPPTCVTNGRTKPICPPIVMPLVVLSCVCANATLPARVLASSANAMHAFVIVFEFSLSMFSMHSIIQILFAFGTATVGPPPVVPEASQMWALVSACRQCGCEVPRRRQARMPNGRKVGQVLCVPHALAVDPLNLTAPHLHARLDSVP